MNKVKFSSANNKITFGQEVLKSKKSSAAGNTELFPFRLVVALLCAALILSIFLALGLGAVHISLPDTYAIIMNRLFGIERPGTAEVLRSANASIIWKIRFPRVLLGVAAGAGLALCGSVMQATVQNPLAEPYILGISSGASLGATIAVFIGTAIPLAGSISSVSLLAFLGAAGATGAVLFLASMGGQATSGKLILSGTIINAICTSFSNFIISVSGDGNGMLSIKFWTMGSLTRGSWNNLILPSCIVAASCIFFLSQYRTLNTMLLGDEAASTLGVNLSFYRKLYMSAAALLTGVLVSACGMIGFVGLMIPHIARAVVGADHRRLLPITILMGGIFLVWADALARVIIPNGELAIGIVTSMIGAPFFAYILIKRHYRFG